MPVPSMTRLLIVLIVIAQSLAQRAHGVQIAMQKMLIFEGVFVALGVVAVVILLRIYRVFRDHMAAAGLAQG